MRNLKIREIKESELDYLWDFEKENRRYDKKILGKKFRVFYPSEINDREKKKWLKEVRKAFKDKTNKIFVAEDSGRLKGYIWANTYILDYLKPKKKAGYICEFFLEKDVRGKGVSAKLMKKALEWFKKQGVEFVTLSVFSKNKRAVKAYKKLGFEEFSVYMKKRIP